MKAVDSIVDIMIREGAKWFFGLSGSTLVSLLDSSSRQGIKFVTGLNENIPVGMADGVARYTGQPTFVALHTTPGFSMALPNLYNAYIDGSPLVIYLGDIDSRHELNEPGLWLNDVRGVVAHYTKWCWKVSTPDDIPRAFRRAIKVATSPYDPGPTCVIVPEDFSNAEIAYEAQNPQYYRVGREILPAKNLISAAAQILKNAERPVIIAGRQVAEYEAVHQLTELAESLNIPVISESPFPFTQTINFPHDHELFVGIFDPEHPFVNTADVILAIGCRVFTERTFSKQPYIPKHCKLIHIHTSPYEIARVYPVSVGIVSDPKSAINALLNEVRSSTNGEPNRANRANYVKKFKEFVEATKNVYREKDSKGYVRTWKLVEAMSQILPEDTVIVDEGIVLSTYLFPFYKFRRPRTLVGRSPGCLGWGVPASLGVKLVVPNRPVLCFTGDGSFLFSPQSLWTASKYQLPVIIVICNNRSYVSVKMSFDSLGTEAVKYVGTDLDPPVDFVKLAESMHAVAYVVEKEEDIIPSLRDALRVGKPTLIDVRIDPLDKGFRFDFKSFRFP
jgi:benzoylformate decarboxylase